MGLPLLGFLVYRLVCCLLSTVYSLWSLSTVYCLLPGLLLPIHADCIHTPYSLGLQSILYSAQPDARSKAEEAEEAVTGVRLVLYKRMDLGHGQISIVNMNRTYSMKTSITN